MNCLLENLVQVLKQRNLRPQQWLKILTDPSVSQQINPRNTTDSKDYSTHLLYWLLEGENRRKGNLEIWRSGWETKTGCFFGTTTVGRISSGIFFLSKLNNDVDMLCDALYQLLLSDQTLELFTTFGCWVQYCCEHCTSIQVPFHSFWIYTCKWMLEQS